MADKKESIEPYDGEWLDFVPAVVAKSAEEAERYRELLSDHDIPAVAATDDELDAELESRHLIAEHGDLTGGVTVLVPEVLLEEASQIIADAENDDEFQVDDDELDEYDEGDEGFGVIEEPPGDGVDKLPDHDDDFDIDEL